MWLLTAHKRSKDGHVLKEAAWLSTFAVAVQYGGQAQAGMAVPAVGMAMPNYSGQPQYAFPNSEVAWYSISPYSCFCCLERSYC